MFITQLVLSIVAGIVIAIVILFIIKCVIFGLVLLIEGKPIKSYLKHREFKKKLMELEQNKNINY